MSQDAGDKAAQQRAVNTDLTNGANKRKASSESGSKNIPHKLSLAQQQIKKLERRIATPSTPTGQSLSSSSPFPSSPSGSTSAPGSSSLSSTSASSSVSVDASFPKPAEPTRPRSNMNNSSQSSHLTSQNGYTVSDPQRVAMYIRNLLKEFHEMRQKIREVYLPSCTLLEEREFLAKLERDLEHVIRSINAVKQKQTNKTDAAFVKDVQLRSNLARKKFEGGDKGATISLKGSVGGGKGANPLVKGGVQGGGGGVQAGLGQGAGLKNFTKYLTAKQSVVGLAATSRLVTRLVAVLKTPVLLEQRKYDRISVLDTLMSLEDELEILKRMEVMAMHRQFKDKDSDKTKALSFMDKRLLPFRSDAFKEIPMITITPSKAYPLQKGLLDVRIDIDMKCKALPQLRHMQKKLQIQMEGLPKPLRILNVVLSWFDIVLCNIYTSSTPVVATNNNTFTSSSPSASPPPAAAETVAATAAAIPVASSPQ